MGDSIRVLSGAKRIEVNDQGESILLNLGDQQFLNRFLDLMDEFGGIQEELSAKAGDIDAMPADTLEEQLAKARAAAELNLSVHLRLRDRVDAVLGEGTCRKVFGDIVPAADLYGAFFEALAPFFQQFAQERAQRLGKYSAERRGNA